VSRLLRLRLYRFHAEWIDRLRGIDRVELEPDQDTRSEHVVLIIGEEEIEPIRRLIIDTNDGDHSKLLLDAFDDQVFFERARLEREANRPKILRLYIYKRYAPILDEIRGLEGEALVREKRARVQKIVSRITYHLDDEEADFAIEALGRIEDEEAREHLLGAIRDERERDPRIRWLIDETPGLAEKLVTQLGLDWFVRWATDVDPDTDERAWDIAREAQHAIAETPTEVEAMRSERIGDPDKWPANTLRAATRVYTEEEGVTPVEALRRAGFLRA
jgi:hypothetical protein